MTRKATSENSRVPARPKKHMKLFSAAIAFILLMSSCGIPQLLQPPVKPELDLLNKIFSIDLPSGDAELTNGLVILYRIGSYADTGDYAVFYESLESRFTNGNAAYELLLDNGYHAMSFQDEVKARNPIPTIDFNDFPSIFSSERLEAGIRSNIDLDEGILLEFPFTTDSDDNVLLRLSGSGDFEEHILLRSVSENSVRGFFPANSTQYREGDEDLKHLSSGEIIDYQNLYVSIAVFSYRATFGDPVQYSIPDMSLEDELIRLSS